MRCDVIEGRGSLSAHDVQLFAPLLRRDERGEGRAGVFRTQGVYRIGRGVEYGEVLFL